MRWETPTQLMMTLNITRTRTERICRTRLQSDVRAPSKESPTNDARRLEKTPMKSIHVATCPWNEDDDSETRILPSKRNVRIPNRNDEWGVRSQANLYKYVLLFCSPIRFVSFILFAVSVQWKVAHMCVRSRTQRSVLIRILPAIEWAHV